MKQESQDHSPAPEETPLPPGITAKQLDAHLRGMDHREQAHKEPLPGSLLEAFAGLPDQIAGLRVRALCHFDFVILRRLESPLLRQLVKSKASKPKTPYNDEEAYAMVYQFTRPAAEIADFFDKFLNVKSAAAAFRKVAREQIGLKLGPIEAGLLVKAVEREFVAYFSTAVNYGPQEADDGSFPLPPAPQRTGSAGGLPTSAS